MFEFVIFLLLLQVKHWYIDFINQNDAEIKSKGIYGDLEGIKHSLKHGLGTSAAVILSFGPFFAVFAVVLGILDSLIHYHIDWAKSNWGNKDIATKDFWVHLGLDQMAHQVTYIVFLAMAIL